MQEVEKYVTQVIEEAGSRDPFEICRHYKIEVHFYNLEMDGLFNVTETKSDIIISKNLSFSKRLYICARFLGHVMMHGFEPLGTVFNLDEDYVEKANFFAKKLLGLD